MDRSATDQGQPTPGPSHEPGEKGKPVKFKLGPLEVEGPLGIVTSLLSGLLVGAIVIIYVVVQLRQPAFLVSYMIDDVVSGTLTAQPTKTPMPTPTPQPEKLVEVIKTVTVEVIKTVEVVRTVTVEVVKTVTVEIERTVIVEVTPTPLTPPDVIRLRLETAFENAENYLQTGDPNELSDLWLGKVTISNEIERLDNTFSEIRSADWKVDDVVILKKESGVEVYTLEVDTTLTINGTYTCSGQELRETLDLPYPSLMRVEIQSLGRVRIYSWTKSSDPIPELCPTPTP